MRKYNCVTMFESGAMEEDTSGKYVLASDCEKAIAEAYKQGIKNALNEDIPYYHCMPEKYASRMMEEI